MTFVRACLFAVSVSVLAAVVLALAFGGLNPSLANLSLSAGAAMAAWTFWRERQHRKIPWRVLHGWEYAAIGAFALFSLRAFLWLVFWDGDKIEVISPNNLGDLSLHLTYIRELANGAPFWPENPIYAGARLTYPIGVDLFHSLLLLAGADLYRTFIWMGLIGSLCTGLALWRWGGAFTVAGFLCNGGLAGFLFFGTWTLADFQAGLAWKSIPLALFVTQRGLLFALPAGLLLLCSWRVRFFEGDADDGRISSDDLLPLWGELLLYASMPIFHLHTFLFLSFMLLAWFIVRPRARRSIAAFVAAAFLPATALVLMITGNFRGPSVLGWLPGWMQTDPDFLAACREHLGTTIFPVTFVVFWAVNFGILPIGIGMLAWSLISDRRLVWARAAVFPAIGIFLLCCFVKFAPWAWDNTKLMVWSYLTVLPFLWRQVVSRLPAPAIAGVCFVLFGSGFVSLLGGLDGSHRGYEIASRVELDQVADALRHIPAGERFIAQPEYNHPLLLLGRKVALGYVGHVWSHGYPYADRQRNVDAILDGVATWPSLAREFNSRYLFWGPRERDAHPDSTQSWRNQVKIVAAGEWGEIFDLESPQVSGGGAKPAAPSSESIGVPSLSPMSSESILDLNH
jgi:hypothetical protein